MAEDLAELHERIDYCQEQIIAFSNGAEGFCSDHIEHWTERDPQGHFVVYAKQTRPVPTALRSQAGMIANELRSSLDGLACQLAIRNGQSAADVYFPISKSKAVFEMDGMRKIKKLSSEDQRKLIELSPFREANPTLFGLHETDRTRKHQRLAACASGNAVLHLGPSRRVSIHPEAKVTMVDCVVDGQAVESFHSDTISITPLSVGQTVVVAAGRSSELTIQPTFSLIYAEPAELAGKTVAGALNDFAIQVNDILKLFE